MREALERILDTAMLTEDPWRSDDSCYGTIDQKLAKKSRKRNSNEAIKLDKSTENNFHIRMLNKNCQKIVKKLSKNCQKIRKIDGSLHSFARISANFLDFFT